MDAASGHDVRTPRFRSRRSSQSRFRGFHVAAAMLVTCFGAVPAAFADAAVSGTISNITFAGNDVLIMTSNGVPSNCTGTPYGWMRIPSDSKPMAAFVLGLWLRGDAASTTVTVYSNGIDSSGYCTLTQLDPIN